MKTSVKDITDKEFRERLDELKREYVRSKLDNFVQKYGRLPHAKEYGKKDGLPYPPTIKAVLKMTPAQYFKLTYPDFYHTDNRLTKCWDESEILLAYSKWFIEYHRLPGMREISQHGLPSENAVLKYFDMDLHSFFESYFSELYNAGEWDADDDAEDSEYLYEENNCYSTVI